MQAWPGHLRLSDHHPTNVAQPANPSPSACSSQSPRLSPALASILLTVPPSNMTSSLSLYWSCTELCSRNAQSCHTVMSLKSLNLSLPWSSQPHMVKVSHPVMQSLLKVAMILPPTSMGPDSQTSWLPSTCAGCSEKCVLAAQLHVP